MRLLVKFDNQLDTPPPTPLLSLPLSQTPSLLVTTPSTHTSSGYVRPISNEYRGHSTARPLTEPDPDGGLEEVIRGSRRRAVSI